MEDKIGENMKKITINPQNSGLILYNVGVPESPSSEGCFRS